MKLNQNFVLRSVADMWVVLPLNQANVDFDGMLSLNSSGVLLWHALEQGADVNSLVDILLNEYEVTRKQAQIDVNEFLETLNRAGCIEE